MDDFSDNVDRVVRGTIESASDTVSLGTQPPTPPCMLFDQPKHCIPFLPMHTRPFEFSIKRRTRAC